MSIYKKNVGNILAKNSVVLKTLDGKPVEIWELRIVSPNTILSAWAKHFREHYCLDSQIDELRNGTGLSRKEYLENIKFPDKNADPGPSVRAGDFGEILVADFLEFIEKYEVPSRRTRYSNKTNRNESTKGSDVIAFKFFNSLNPNPTDELAIFEAKAKFTGRSASQDTKKRLQDAINDSAKDRLRIAESLNAMKQRFLDKNNKANIEKIERFQNEADTPYKTINGSVALVCDSNYSTDIATTADASNHPNKLNLRLIIIKGADMMKLVHELYKRAADEA
jgi:hypothetical protein